MIVEEFDKLMYPDAEQMWFIRQNYHIINETSDEFTVLDTEAHIRQLKDAQMSDDIKFKGVFPMYVTYKERCAMAEMEVAKLNDYLANVITKLADSRATDNCFFQKLLDEYKKLTYQQ